MDAFGLIYYAVVCGGLALFLDGIRNRTTRIVIGLVTGLAAASIAPIIRNFL